MMRSEPIPAEFVRVRAPFLVFLMIGALAHALADPSWAQATASARPAEPYIDRGVCPFECCTYREWHAVNTIGVHASPRPEAVVVAHLSPTAPFDALTGEVHFRRVGVVLLQRSVTLRDEAAGDSLTLRSGDRAYVLSALGEGYYRVWVRGRILEVPFFWDDRATYPRPTDEPGRLEQVPEKIWWVQVRTPTGISGWIRMDQAQVRGADQCGD
jgi:hypothetical protein